ncbi:MAG: cytochrome P450 [Ilumatobacter sp.]|jgi:cytochrome P450|uniref:cytochrome P450 n=1 Tax=Ilumatobacter sp. TaxID=1967498 RepID=UPI00391CCC5B
MVDDELLTPERVRDPYPYFRQLQEEAPVHWNEKYRAWVVSRFDDVSEAFRDPRYSSDRISAFSAIRHVDDADAGFDEVLRVLSGWLVFKDPPDHTRLRRLMQGAFTVKSIEAWRPRVSEIVTELIDDIDADTIDVVRDIAYPLPAIVIAEMLGVPPEDRDLFKQWSDEITALVFGALDQPDRRERAVAGMSELADYLRGLINAHQGDADDDLLGSLLNARDQSDALTTDEVLSTCVLLLFGGHETTTSLIGSATLALLEAPDQLEQLRSNPQMMGSAVEEFLRFDGPAKVSVRIVADEIELRGETLLPGQRVFLVPNAANRDARRFSQPDTLDIDRPDGGHVGFGGGIHYCLGAPLARLEGGLAISGIINRLQGLELCDRDALSWHPTLLSRSLQNLPVRFDEVAD